MMNPLAHRISFVILTLILALVSMALSVLMLRSDVYAQDPPTPTPALDPVHRANVELIEAQISDVRELPLITVNKQAVVREDLDRLVAIDLETRYTADNARTDRYFYQALGLLPMNVDFYTLATSVVTASPTDYYDPPTNTIYVLPVFSSVLTLSEVMRYGENYTYALLEQQFGAMRQLAATDNTDQGMAMRAVIEGDIQFTLEQLAILLVESGTYSLESLLAQAATFRTRDLPTSPPRILVEEAYFGAEDGYRFVQSLYSETNSWRLVNLLYERPPLSTEHILHPTLYLLYEAPHAVEVTPLDALWQSRNESDWQLVTDRTVGEFYLRHHLALGLDAATIDQVASGWGGDRLLVYVGSDDRFVMVWRTSWDSTTDFEEFLQSYPIFLGEWLRVGGVPTTNRITCWETQERSMCQVAVGEDVIMVSASSPELAQAAIQFQFGTLNAIFG